MASNMYPKTKTWNPFVGCRFGCVYCVPTFHRTAKRQGGRCRDCYNYTPHTHPNRLKGSFPSSIKFPIVFPCGTSDISFCPPDFTRQIFEAISKREQRKQRRAGAEKQTYYLQSKRPEYFQQFLDILPEQVTLVTTLETNRDEGYERISGAPKPSIRYEQFRDLAWPRKVLTIEPILDFDMKTFCDMVRSIEPDYVWVGFNSKPKQVSLPEPSVEKVQEFIDRLWSLDSEVRGKTLRGVVLHPPT